MRCPSLRWAAGQGPVLVGTIGSLWPSWDAGEGKGCWAQGMLGRGTLRSEGDRKASPGGSGVDMGKGQDHKRQIQSSSSSSHAPQRRSVVPRQPLGQ